MITLRKTLRPVLLLLAGVYYATAPANGQLHSTSLSLEDCYRLAEAHYPLIRQGAIIERSRDYSVEGASRGYWPQLHIAGQATYQSEVTTLPVTIPGIEVPQVSKDQYKIYGEVTQTVLDNGVIRSQQQLIRTSAQTDAQRNAVELYRLRERINGLYFGILAIDAQLRQVTLQLKDIQYGLDKINAAIANGTALKSGADVLRAGALQVEQRRIELQAGRKAYSDMLSVFTGEAIGDSTRLELPPLPVISQEITRPELRIYELQKGGLEEQRKLLQARSLPRLGLFFQGGLGRPALNFLNNDLRGYYIGGLRLSWNISSFYTLQQEKARLELSKEAVDIQQDVFLFNTRLGMMQYNAEMLKLGQLLETDREIVELRTRVKETAAAQLANGVITGSDYLREVTNEDRARQDMELHRIQLLMASWSFRTTAGQ